MTRFAIMLIGVSITLCAVVARADVILCTGMSNAEMECNQFRKNNETEHQIINGARWGFDYYRQQNETEAYWAKVEEFLGKQGLTLADVDIVYNKNTLSYNNGPSGTIPFSQRVEDQTNGIIWFQAEAESRLPNMQAGYHGIRSSGEWCDKSPQDLADAHPAAIATAITYSNKWAFGPDLSAPDYVREDFASDGCHPSASGLAKITPILNAFFQGEEPPAPPVCLEWSE